MDEKDNEIFEEETECDEMLEDDDIVTLFSQDGKKISFTEVAGIVFEGKFYAILQPLELLEGMSEDEALVFAVSSGENGEDQFNLVLDDRIIDGVFKEYDRLYEESQDGSDN